MASRYGGITGTEQIANDYQNINIAFENVEADVDAKAAIVTDHINSTAAHAAEHITYSGSASGDNVKDAIDTIDERIDTIIQGGGPDKDAELVDIRTPDPSYTPSRIINVAGDIVRDMQAQFGAQLADIAFNAHNFNSIDSAVAAASANGGVLLLPPGEYPVNSNLVVPQNVTLEIANGAMLNIMPGVVLTINSRINAGDYKIFTGSGSISGLKDVNLMWFAGDKLNTSTDALADIQKAYDSCSSKAVVRWPSGFFCISGASPIVISKGQHTIGAGSFGTELRYLTSAMNGFQVSGQFAKMEGLSLDKHDQTLIPTSGIGLSVTAGNFWLYDVTIRTGYRSISIVGAGTVKLLNFNVHDSVQSGVYCENSNDVYLSDFTIAAINDYCVLSGVTGTFVVGEVVTFSGGASGTIASILAPNILKIKFGGSNPSTDETITGSTSGASATVASVTIMHSLGGIRLFNRVEAFVARTGDVIGGRYSITTDAAANTSRQRPSFNRFSDMFFDSADNGALFDKSVEFNFVGCWFSSSAPGSGATINAVDGFTFEGTTFANNYQHGCVVQSSAKRVIFTAGCKFMGNSRQTANTYNGITIAAGTTDFAVTNCVIGGTLDFATQARGVVVSVGASDRYIVADNIGGSANGTGAVSDGGTGTNKRVANNY